MSRQEAAIALSRFGMGARPGEINEIASDPRGWLLEQVNAPDKALITNDGLMTTQEATRFVINGIQQIKEARRAADAEQKSANELTKIRKKIRASFEEFYEIELKIRIAHAITTQSSFSERWVRFWSNNFSVSTRHPNLLPMVNAFEREAIRPNVFGQFSDMLKASTFHPTMLYYLDNHVSVGPSSKAVEWAKYAGRTPPGLNENLAREVLELHTLGVDSGYQQADVLAFAKMLTGWTIFGLPSFAHDKGADVGEVIFFSKKHERRRQVFLNKIYPAKGAGQAKMALVNLAKHPATARHISMKLLRHFVDDEPNLADITILETTFLDTEGDLKELAKALINLKTMWRPKLRKFKTPEDLMVSTARAVGMDPRDIENPINTYKVLGQLPFNAPSPEGWSDNPVDWTGSDMIKKRIEWAYEFAGNISNSNSGAELLENALGHNVSDKTLHSVKRADNEREALALAIMSPEFQRR